MIERMLGKTSGLKSWKMNEGEDDEGEDDEGELPEPLSGL
jgi:hypothetical protein